jgi:ketosteroid isomerase-like protein
MLSTSHLHVRLLAFAAAALFALGLAACGDSDDGGDGSADQGDRTADGDRSGGAGGSSDESRARATVERLYAGIRAGDADAVCSTLTAPAQKQVAAGAIGSGKAGSCADAFQQFLDAAEKQGGLNLTLKAKVERVTVKGDKAVAKVSFGKTRAGEIPLVKQDGEWKLDRAGAGPG